MSTTDNREKEQCSQPERDRLEKLRAFGRQMELRTRLEVLMRESASKEQQHLHEREALTAQMESERRMAADRERDLHAQIENSRLQMEMVLNSRSWKITRPLRDVTGWLEARKGTNPEQAVSPGAGSNQSPFARGVDHPAVTAAEDSGTDLQRSEVPQADRATKQEPAVPKTDNFLTGGKDAWDEAGTKRLREFLSSDERLAFPKPEQPTVSIIIALFNKVHLTILCLDSLLQNAGEDYELILVDNNSTDETVQLLDRLDGVNIIRNSRNTGFGAACMQGAQSATGAYLCFLNNDLVLCPGALESATANFRDNENIGAVGGKLLLSDGRVQEAGSIVWRDGTAWGYGREGDPASPKYAFRRPVDYCSGALLVTPRALFEELGGFDEQFLPAYYEDTDYCFKVWGRGRSVVYEPNAVAHHYESASMQGSEAGKALIEAHRARFIEKWKSKLQKQLPLSGAKIPYARFAVQAGGLRILYMYKDLPHRDLGSDSAQANEFVTRLASNGQRVTCVSTSSSPQSTQYTDISRDIELANAQDAHYVFRELLSQYDVVWISGSESMREFLWHLWDLDERVPPIIYEPGKIPAAGSADSDDAEAAERFEDEVALCQAADVVIVPTDPERRALLAHRVNRVEVLSQDTADRILAEVVTPAIVNSY